jgi:hypothetical protein
VPWRRRAVRLGVDSIAVLVLSVVGIIGLLVLSQ